ncbi:putative Pterin-4a-carbinolamine dehydratase [Thiomonas arsenitoxydans]|uniref:4a-hydroxytetrahydrobiopterin dehydratase n=1 Tax=Thiomonas arsenitoxydans (strain DSM 22701 / CIP 110005 / 3As) TaxID=426114 RepID=D6CQL0_THIA3|nr:4a-hydroxytetrahydrobiopterin dehydratase [Thiomonas arsenitoxydans]CAZ86901.1 putative Pterin-4a-carbinolamine dehydratase [Thiomonas arsenitoxydans]CQR27964.1 putative Pterin-4a-carbinolamine dehydratase [Thiomonas arsenitoxydans]CQR30439.1 putative Pterin-4a-carbinolamine dehydratase [Thiomonas arsenitoxydans]CQR31930.1 putative Pterin-4a-carbinolamine dehydratase [Thiomonas arsenitoxydans]CQR33978.1 putative Pterin-4a-carbinolamine dehydratase [Thiomonas arsenitoxydans]
MDEQTASWREQGKPPMLFKRFAFGSYAQTRAFLDALAALSEETGQHPQNINFGTTYVNITLDAADGATLGEAERAFAARVNALAGSSG